MNTITHKLIATQVLDNIDKRVLVLLRKDSFIWGNIKPDTVSKYKLTKHYLVESFELVIDKINYLSSMSMIDFRNEKEVKKFSRELGIICHFLCDYFTMPHYDRWEFKHSMKKHIKYENGLYQYAKSYKFVNPLYKEVVAGNLADYILEKQMEYSAAGRFDEDLDFAYEVCSVVVYKVIQQVLKNEPIKIKKLIMV